MAFASVLPNFKPSATSARAEVLWRATGTARVGGAGLVLAGRHGEARAVAGFVPDCVVLVRRLLADDRVPRRRKLLLGCLIAYLVLPFDLVSDFIPVAGQLDDAIFAVVV